LVRRSGATMKMRTLKRSAKAMEPKTAPPPPFISSSGRFFVGTGKRPGTPPVIPAKSPSPSTTAGVSATSTSFASATSASANASLAE
jgi:hypothetical protein